MYARSADDKMGCIEVQGNDMDSTVHPSIGAAEEPGPITINGGHLYLISGKAADIGSGRINDLGIGGSAVTINGGIVEINGWNDKHEVSPAAGIGDGKGGGAGDIAIKGGTTP